jgi:hypothetical protein
MGMLIKQGKGYTGAALAWRRVEVADPRKPDRSMNERRTRMPILCTQSSEYALFGRGRWKTTLDPLFVCERFDRGQDEGRSRDGDKPLSSKLKSIVEARGLRYGRCGKNGRCWSHEEGEEEG